MKRLKRKVSNYLDQPSSGGGFPLFMGCVVAGVIVGRTVSSIFIEE